jgi:hypothetical protein
MTPGHPGILLALPVMAGTSEGRIAAIRRRFGDGAYAVDDQGDLGRGATAALVASRTTFSWKGLVLLSQHVVVRAIARPTPADIEALCEGSFHVARKRNKVPLPRGLQFGYMIVPVVVADEVSQAVLDLVSRAPPKRLGIFTLPVICEAATGNVHFFRGTPLWGAFFFSDLRAVVGRYLSPG